MQTVPSSKESLNDSFDGISAIGNGPGVYNSPPVGRENYSLLKGEANIGGKHTKTIENMSKK